MPKARTTRYDMFIMKKIQLWSIFLLVAMALPMMVACSDDDEKTNNGSSNTTDVAVTGNVSKIGATYARIDGYVNLNLITSSYTSQRVGIEFSMKEDFKEYDQAETRDLEGNKISIIIGPLNPQAKYYYRTFVRVNDLNYYGKTRSFTTKDFSTITITGEASDLTFTSAKVSCKVDAGSIDRDERFQIGVAYSTSKSQLHSDSVCYYSGYTTTLFNTVICPLDSVMNKTYDVSISKLQTGRTYYYCSFTCAGNKYTLGEIKSFTTLTNEGYIYLNTSEAVNISNKSATLQGWSKLEDLYKNDAYIAYSFQYSDNLGKLTNNVDFSTIPSDNNNGVLSADLTKLTAGTTYY